MIDLFKIKNLIQIYNFVMKKIIMKKKDNL